ncbi:MAG: DUF4434 domain-containing protein [Melioribacteraceae bacterium]|nr:DUF4434 domain-containing protein [Melioribacteraceae bacterium]
MKITGTFLDEISHDIPSANWGKEDWANEFKVMKSVGIDTVILIRSGYKDKITFNSKTLSKHQAMRPAYTDLVDLFLNEAEKNSMDFYFGMYDSGKYWHEGKHDKEIDLNLALAEEVMEKYGHRKAFKGWYLSHEFEEYNEGQLRLYEKLAVRLKEFNQSSIMMSPYIKGRLQFEKPITPMEHEKMWSQIFSSLEGKVDICAFQDGQVDFLELQAFMEINKKLADKYSITSWSNVETFERGMPINFLPINWNNLRYKLEVAEKVGVDKIITFEFSHFLSPHSVYPAAHNLFNRYKEWITK